MPDAPPAAGPARDAAAIDALLPQTQCRRCGYPSCRDYAHALARNETLPDRCPPGGESVLEALGALLDVAVERVDPTCGESGPWRIARVVEARCIGCTLCIDACPVDAIVGAGKMMHTVLEDECTACELCLPPCPVDCIDLVPLPGSDEPGFVKRWMGGAAAAARERFVARERRRIERTSERARGRRGRSGRLAEIPSSFAARRASLEAALATTGVPGGSDHRSDHRSDRPSDRRPAPERGR